MSSIFNMLFGGGFPVEGLVKAAEQAAQEVQDTASKAPGGIYSGVVTSRDDGIKNVCIDDSCTFREAVFIRTLAIQSDEQLVASLASITSQDDPEWSSKKLAQAKASMMEGMKLFVVDEHSGRSVHLLVHRDMVERLAATMNNAVRHSRERQARYEAGEFSG